MYPYGCSRPGKMQRSGRDAGWVHLYGCSRPGKMQRSGEDASWVHLYRCPRPGKIQRGGGERSISLSELYLSSSETADRMHRSCIPLSRMYLFTFEIADRMHRSCIPFSRPYLAAFKKTCRMQVLKLVHAGAGFHASSRTPAGFQDASGAAQKGSGTAERGPHPYQQRTSWPSSVTRTWISHWAEGLPSAV